MDRCLWNRLLTKHLRLIHKLADDLFLTIHVVVSQLSVKVARNAGKNFQLKCFFSSDGNGKHKDNWWQDQSKRRSLSLTVVKMEQWKDSSEEDQNHLIRVRMSYPLLLDRNPLQKLFYKIFVETQESFDISFQSNNNKRCRRKMTMVFFTWHSVHHYLFQRFITNTNILNKIHIPTDWDDSHLA